METYWGCNVVIIVIIMMACPIQADNFSSRGYTGPFLTGCPHNYFFSLSFGSRVVAGPLPLQLGWSEVKEQCMAY
jgi:hypothetical protein